MSKTQIVGMPEILGTFLNNADSNALKADAHRFIKDNANIDLSGTDVNIVENAGSTMHVALPYYSVVVNSIAPMDEADLDASGGDDSFILNLIDTTTAFQLGVASGILEAAPESSREEARANASRIVSEAFAASDRARADLASRTPAAPAPSGGK